MKNKFPLKHFGQNYLRDENIIRKIIDEISPKKSDLIIEIGAGEGALTSKLLDTTDDFFSAEIDKRNIEILKNKFPRLKLLEGDFLEVNLKQIKDKHDKKLRIVGNIPYNITSPIIFKLIENRELISDSVLMIQYEVAKRITAQSGGKDYGILSVITQYFAETELCFKVSPNVFFPRPKVYSAVIHLKFRDALHSREESDTFIKIVKAAFGNRRKMLYNSFKNSIFAHLNFNETGVDLTLRAENLTIADFQKLASFAHNHMSSSHRK